MSDSRREGTHDLSPIPRESAAAYAAAKEDLIRAVDAEMAGLPEIDGLIGGNPRAVMYDNHRHHAGLMANVLWFDNIPLLARVVPWVYRSYGARRFSLDYFPRALSAWSRAIEHHLESVAAAPVLALYRWLRDNHAVWVEASRDEGAFLPPVDDGSPQLKERFMAALIKGDDRECLRIVREAVKNEADIERLYLQVMQPCLYQVGSLWERGTVSVAEEHLATAIVSRVMASLYGHFVGSGSERGRAVVACAPNEYHEVGGRMVADLLEMDGWDVAFLGANMPPGDLIALLKGHLPDLMALSITMPFNIEACRELITAIRVEAALAHLPVMVGGLAFWGVPELWAQTGADGWASDGREAVRLARQWREERRRG